MMLVTDVAGREHDADEMFIHKSVALALASEIVHVGGDFLELSLGDSRLDTDLEPLRGRGMLVESTKQTRESDMAVTEQRGRMSQKVFNVYNVLAFISCAELLACDRAGDRIEQHEQILHYTSANGPHGFSGSHGLCTSLATLYTTRASTAPKLTRYFTVAVILKHFQLPNELSSGELARLPCIG